MHVEKSTLLLSQSDGKRKIWARWGKADLLTQESLLWTKSSTDKDLGMKPSPIGELGRIVDRAESWRAEAEESQQAFEGTKDLSKRNSWPHNMGKNPQ